MTTTPNDHIYIDIDNGKRIMFGQVDPSRKEMLRRGMEELSDNSRYLRFMHPVSRLSEKELEYFSNVDQYNHVAWGAVEVTPEGDRGIAIGRYVRSDKEPEKAEFALTVIDDFQALGVGRILLSILYVVGRRQGLRYLTGIVMPHNTHATERLRMLNAETKSVDGVIEVSIPILANNELPDNLFANSMKNTLLLIEPMLFND